MMKQKMSSEKKEQMHGHRERVRRRYLENGLESFREDYEVLELLLFYAIPYKDTKELAKNLISSFGSFHAVLDASIEELQAAGLTENAAAFLKLMPDVQSRYEQSKTRELTSIRSTADAGAVCCGMFRNQLEESVRMLCLDAAGKIVKRAEVSKGDVNAVHFPVRKIVEAAISSKAVSVILAHNHPGGTLSPSREDLEATKSVQSALDPIGVRFLDHLIVSGTSYCSLREEGYL